MYLAMPKAYVFEKSNLNMDSIIARFSSNVNRIYIVYVSWATLGTFFTFRAASSVMDGSSSWSMILGGIIGVCMVAGSLYSVLTYSPSDSEVNRGTFWAAVMLIIGTLLIWIS